jgi:hypothetical protein
MVLNGESPMAIRRNLAEIGGNWRFGENRKWCHGESPWQGGKPLASRHGRAEKLFVASHLNWITIKHQ